MYSNASRRKLGWLRVNHSPGSIGRRLSQLLPHAPGIASTLLLATIVTFHDVSAAPSADDQHGDYKTWARSQWPMVGGDLGNTRYSALEQIAPSTVKKLGATWISTKFHDGGTSRSPIVVNNGLLFVTAGRHVYALNARTGQTIWTHNTVPDARPSEFIPTEENALAALNSPKGVPNGKGVGVGDGMVFVGLKDGHVIALDQSNGKLKWATQTGISHPKKGQWAAVAPTYAQGMVFTGLSDGDHNLRGRMVALDAKTGQQRWSKFSVPAPGEAGHETWPSFNETWKVGGGGVWTNPPVDPDLGLAYFTAGNAVPAYAGDWRPGANLYTGSVMAIDLKTGKLKWHFQLIHHDVFEADLGIPIVLYDAVISGRPRKALAVMRADGHLFQLDRTTGESILAVEERAVPQSESQKTWPTQPFPVNGESLLMSCDDWKKEPIPKGFTVGCMFTPPASPPPSPDPQNVLVPFPATKGGLMAYSPKTRYFYAHATSRLHWPRRSQDPYFLNWVGVIPGLRSYAELAAIDSRTGKVAWRKRKLNAYGSGPLVTAGGVMFYSAGDGNLEAYDARNGDLLWKFNVGTAAGPAATFEIDGEQYVALSAGPAVWAFKLGGSIPPSPSTTLAAGSDDFPGSLVDADQIETTTLHRSLIEPGARYFVDEFTFNPGRARVRAGQTVLFVNNGTMRHEIVAVDGSWGTGPLGPTQEAWLKFDEPGTHTYICKDHPFSYGQIVISAADTKPKATSLPSASPSSSAVTSSNTQPMRGRDQFNKYCSACHGEDLSGRASAPALLGAAFMSRWNSATVHALFDNVRTTMPQTNPGSLSRQAYLDIVAYLLYVNNAVHPEEELSDDVGALSTKRILQSQ